MHRCAVLILSTTLTHGLHDTQYLSLEPVTYTTICHSHLLFGRYALHNLFIHGISR